MRFVRLSIFIATGLVVSRLRAAEPAANIEFFETKIRPVLVEQCYSCHNSAKTAKGGLSLDDRASLLKGGTEGVVVVAGKPERSRLIATLKHELDGKAMPKNGQKLDKNVIADFEKWIVLGMPDPRGKPPTAEELTKATSWETILEARKKWWSFQPIRDPAPPDSAWSKHPVDRFIAAKLKENKLEPGTAAADSATLIRRLYFTLVGLPPTPAEMERWTAKLKTEGGYEELVDHLLGTQQFGEHWARHWMDWTRYADSHGSEGDPEIVGAWHYRDYLIRAINADVPYDQLVREHVAGDLLKSPRIDKKMQLNESAIGTAHWRMVFHGFAPTDALEEKVRFIDDQINTFSKAFLGLTVSCARCHDHKFDAIGQKDYYALFGVLASNRPARMAVDTAEVLGKNKAEMLALKKAIRVGIAKDWYGAIRDLQKTWLDERGSYVLPKAALFDPLRQLNAVQGDEKKSAEVWNTWSEGQTRDRALRAEFAGRKGLRRWDFADEAATKTWFRTGAGLETGSTAGGEFAIQPTGDRVLVGLVPSGIQTNLISDKYAARFESPGFKLTADSDLWLRVRGDGGATLRYVVQDYPRDGTVFPVVRLGAGWHWQKFELKYWTGDDIHIELSTAMDAPLMAANSPRSWFAIREAILVKRGDPAPPSETRESFDPIFDAFREKPPQSARELADQYLKALHAAIRAWGIDETATEAQVSLLNRAVDGGLLPSSIAALPSTKATVEAYRKLEAEIAVPTRVPGLMEGIVRNQPLLERGDHKRPKAEVPRRFLEAFDPTPYKGEGSGRLQLAEDLLSDKNPLAKRVIVNRLWHHAFGRGIVPTPDNFGRLGIEPTHLELLDFLATRFVKRGWSIKETLRFLVTSKTWQLASKPTEQARQLDPDNRWLSHASLRRLEAEAIRDSLLAVSGSLNRDLYGEPVGGGSDRRSLYVRVQRTALDPFLRAFDFPEPFSAVGRRDVTNVPAQSLTLLNDPRIAALADHWAGQILADPKLNLDDDRLQRMVQTALGRHATPAEIETFRGYLTELKLNRGVLAARATSLRGRLDAELKSIRDILDPMRVKLQKDAKDKPIADEKSTPKPLAKWDFQDSIQDSIGTLHGFAVNKAELRVGGLKVGGTAHVLTAPLAKTIREKTLEAWVQLATLDQAGGAAMTIQTKDGGVFDAIVFGEKDAGQWVPGSNFFQRTQSLRAPKETEAVLRVVHLAITYAAGGKIVAYRDGSPYGTGYTSIGPQEYKAGEAVVGFGIRHSPAGGNKVLAGTIVRARLYDKALSAEEVLASFDSVSGSIPDSKVLGALSAGDREKVIAAKKRLAVFKAELLALGTVPTALDDRAIWADIARAIFNFKEFIYIK